MESGCKGRLRSVYGELIPFEQIEPVDHIFCIETACVVIDDAPTAGMAAPELICVDFIEESVVFFDGDGAITAGSEAGLNGVLAAIAWSRLPASAVRIAPANVVVL